MMDMSEELFDSIENNIKTNDDIEAGNEKKNWVIMNQLYQKYQEYKEEFEQRGIPYSVSNYGTYSDISEDRKLIKYNTIVISIGRDKEIKFSYQQDDLSGTVIESREKIIDSSKSNESKLVFRDDTEESYDEHVIRQFHEGNVRLERRNNRYK